MEQETVEKRNRLRFTYNDELVLLREFVSLNPILHPENWESIQKHLQEILGKQFLIRTLKKHLKLLLDLFLKKDEADNKKSGIEEPYTERDNLLQEIADMCQKNSSIILKTKKVPSKEKILTEIGVENRERMAIAYHENLHFDRTSTDDHNYVMPMDDVTQPLEVVIPPTNETLEICGNTVVGNKSECQIGNNSNLAETIREEKSVTCQFPSKSSKVTPNYSILGPSRRRINRSQSVRKNALDYIRDKQVKENEIRLKEIELQERKLQIEERKIAIEEQKLELELTERKQKIDLERDRISLEIQERNTLNELVKSQQKIIETLLQQINNR